MNHKHKLKLVSSPRVHWSGVILTQCTTCGAKRRFWQKGIHKMLLRGGLFKESLRMGSW